MRLPGHPIARRSVRLCSRLLADSPLQEAMHEAADCRRCHLHEPATQTVFGEGPAHAGVHVRGRAAG